MWQIERTTYEPEKRLVEESLFTVGNGYLGVRGCFEEGTHASSMRGTYINGLYDRVPMRHAEMAYGFPEIQDKQPRIIDTQTCEVYLDDERVTLKPKRYRDYVRRLDYRKGLSERRYVFKTKSGKEGEVSFERLASLTRKNLLIYRIKVVYDGKIELRSKMDCNIQNRGNTKDPRVGAGHMRLMKTLNIAKQDNQIKCLMETAHTRIEQATVVRYQVMSKGAEVPLVHLTNETEAMTIVTGHDEMVMEKLCIFTDGLRHGDAMSAAEALAEENLETDFSKLCAEQSDFLNRYWAVSDIEIFGDDRAQISVRFMLFQLLQSVGTDAYSNISAKGLSGAGYEGHYFWDTEIYVLPIMQMTQPEIAESLLKYRHRILPMAGKRARELGHAKGVAYPWRTISGIECSGYFPAGTAQYHINADIAYAFIQHYLYNEDLDFMADYGLEVLFETARLWRAIGSFHRGEFMIHSVTGPDEYTALVSNNYYTNAMAKYNLTWAVKLYEIFSKLGGERHEKFKALCERLSLDDAEIDRMRDSAEHMYFAYDAVMDLYAQDDTFLTKPVWPFRDTPKDHYPLLLYFHPLTIYRHQVLKQADTLLAHFLLEDYVTDLQISNAYSYYEPLTTHDSSLSTCIYGIMASRCGREKQAESFFMESLRLDLDDTHHNTKDGLHMANMGGTLLGVVAGFSGLRIKEEGLVFRPTCPGMWQGYRYHIKYKARLLEVHVTESTFKLKCISGNPLEVEIFGEKYLVENEVNIGTKNEGG